MSDGQQAGVGRGDSWADAMHAARAMSLALGPLRSDRQPTLEAIRNALRGVAERTDAMTLLGELSAEYTVAVLPELVRVALSQRDTYRVRQLIGQLPYDDTATSVPSVVWAQLAQTTDDDAYRRMAELLKHLGLTQTLRALCEKAAMSTDPGIREVAADFAP